MKRRGFLKSLAVIALAPKCLANLRETIPVLLAPKLGPNPRCVINPDWVDAEYEVIFFEGLPTAPVFASRRNMDIFEKYPRKYDPWPMRYTITQEGKFEEVPTFKLI